jgi:alanine racemase
VYLHDPTVIEISLDNLIYNVDHIKQSVNTALKVIAVVKDNAYGCGASPIASMLEQHNRVDMFAVARYQEAAQLRKDGIRLPILILGRTSPEVIQASLLENIIYTLNDLEDCTSWARLTVPVDFHIAIDTGMTRLGILPYEIDNVISVLSISQNLHCKGVYTHFACADDPGTTTVTQQLILFNQVVSTLRSRGISPEAIHFSNSAATVRFSPEGCTHIRPGVMLYGCKPDPKQDFAISLKSVISLKSCIVKLKRVPKSTKVSYGGNYTTAAETWIGVIPAGYAQGVPRYLSNKGEVLIRVKRYKIAGNVTMDYIMINAGPDSELRVGDEVIIIGDQGNESITPDQIAIAGNTIGYEVICNLGKSIRRIYKHNDGIVREFPGTIF